MMLFGLFVAVLLAGCQASTSKLYNGRVEATIYKIPIQTVGIIQECRFQEGMIVSINQILAIMNTDQLYIQKQQNHLQFRELEFAVTTNQAQLAQVQANYSFAKETLAKTQKMVDKGAASLHQRNELVTQLKVLAAQLTSAENNIQIIRNKQDQLKAADAILDLQLRHSVIKASQKGTIINQFMHQGEYANPGSILAELADLDLLEVTIYIPLNLITALKIGQKVQVKAEGMIAPFMGQITWIAAEAEFTPKTILTQEARTTLVYAVKVQVKNPEGQLKIGIPVDVDLLP